MTVLSCLSLTTVPCSVRFGIVASSTLRLRALLLRDRLQPRDVAAHLAHPRRILELPGRPLEAQVELLLLELDHLFVDPLDVHASDVRGFHGTYSAMRSMKRVLIGSFAAARSRASRAT